jgi:PmbA protein
MEYLEEILRCAKRVAEQAEVFWVSSQETPVHFEANKLKQIETKGSSSVALRIFKEGKIGFSAATVPHLSLSLKGEGEGHEVETLLDMAIETSQFGLPANFIFPPLKDHPEVNIFDPKVERITMAEMIEYGNQLIARVREYAPNVLCDAGVIKGTSSVGVINSQGGKASYDKSFFSLGLEGILIQDTDMLFVGDSESSCRLPDKVDIVADRVIKQLQMAKKKATVPAKPLPVIFTPHGVASAFLTPLAVAFNGKTVLEGASPLKDRLGEPVFDKKLSLWDDATLDYCLNSSPCDDEGVPGQRISVIKEGVVSNFLYDLQTAALAGAHSTSSGRRTGDSLQIKPAISSLIIKEGEVSFEDMVQDIREGLIVEYLIGADQGNLLSGDFGGNVLLGYKVENGNIVGRVKDTMISGNIYQALKEVSGIGCEARWVNGVLRTPHLYCPSLSVAAKG